MILEHYSLSALPLDLDNLVRHRRPRQDKPHGLWLSVPGEDDWPAYLATDGSKPAPHRHLVTLADDARLLRLDTAHDVLSLWRRHPSTASLFDPCMHGTGIDWAAIQAAWDGIVIAVHHREARYDELALWYLSWDCACACVWNGRAIASAFLADA